MTFEDLVSLVLPTSFWIHFSICLATSTSASPTLNEVQHIGHYIEDLSSVSKVEIVAKLVNNPLTAYFLTSLFEDIDFAKHLSMWSSANSWFGNTQNTKQTGHSVAISRLRFIAKRKWEVN
jgi:hypothetical protein